MPVFDQMFFDLGSPNLASLSAIRLPCSMDSPSSPSRNVNELTKVLASIPSATGRKASPGKKEIPSFSRTSVRVHSTRRSHFCCVFPIFCISANFCGVPVLMSMFWRITST
ncbi:hypothetical protein Fcan01_24301 [Folsomia candida]|uniref:Uncharacterized protein n=1 Tax=Folsomia candida TaxID=158441 RepID=A0A226D5X4_FOLCA|nr:hypothetical protein Fcan01_24301 [Folsomia candida]